MPATDEKPRALPCVPLRRWARVPGVAYPGSCPFLQTPSRRWSRVPGVTYPEPEAEAMPVAKRDRGPGGYNARLSPEEKLKIDGLLARGVKRELIARELGRSIGAICNYLIRTGRRARARRAAA